MGIFYPQITASFAGNTTGTTVTQFTGNLVFAGGTNITLSNSTNSDGQTVSFIGGAGGGGGGSFFGGISTGGNTSGTSGTNSLGVVFVGGNNITLSQATDTNGNTITISNGIPVIAGTNTQTVQTIYFSNSNGWVIGINASTITMRDRNVTGFSNYQAAGLAANGVATSKLSLQRMYFPRNFDATALEFIGHMTGSSAAESGAITMSVGLYSINVSTLTRIASASQAITWTSGSAVTVSSNWGGNSGTRYRSLALGTWDITPGDYVFGVILDTASSQTAHSWTFYGMSSLSIQAVPGGGNYTNFFGNGLLILNTSALPATIHLTNIDQTGASVNRQPFFRMLGTF